MYALTVWLGSRPSTLARIYLLVGRLQKIKYDHDRGN
jgi:hypothetical protein